MGSSLIIVGIGFETFKDCIFCGLVALLSVRLCLLWIWESILQFSGVYGLTKVHSFFFSASL